MMKKILILAYIMAVLALSGMVKADIVRHESAPITSADVSPRGILNVQYQLRTSCHINPRLVVSGFDDSTRTVSLMVQTDVANGMCLDVVNFGHKILDLKSTKSLHFRVGYDYKLAFENYPTRDRATLDYHAVASDPIEDNYSATKQDFEGTLVKTEGFGQSPTGFALQSGSEEFSIVSTDMLPELDSLMPGETVQISGYVVNIGALNGSESLALDSQGANIAQVIVPVSISQ